MFAAEPPASEALVRAMLARMAWRGAATGIQVDGPASLGVGRHEWETGAEIGGEAVVAVHDRVAVACDASLYYKAHLKRQLATAGVTASGDAPAQLIAAAYHAWGEDLVHKLEGDFAFVLWDGARRRAFAARDFVGSRPLYYAHANGSFVVASTPGGVLTHPAVSPAYDVAGLAAIASGLFGHPSRTVFRDVRALPAGHVIRFSADGQAPPRVEPWWSPPPFADRGSGPAFAEAALELRGLLQAAVAERLPKAGQAAISLSGGWDSPSVFGAAQAVLREQRRAPNSLHPISLSFPPGDAGHEDDLIREIVAFWRLEPDWLNTRELPMFAHAGGHAAARDEPFGHPFMSTNRALNRAAVRVGARVMLNGLGGDQLFHAEPAYLADLVRRGRLLAACHEWQANGGGWSTAREYMVRPLLGRRAQRLIGRIRGGAGPRAYLQPRIAPWVRLAGGSASSLLDDERLLVPPLAGESAAAFERRYMMVHPFYPRITQEFAELALEDGVEQRAPLLDGRLVAFAATRPREERHAGRETKTLLRAAVAGLLPERVLAPRESKTGLMSDYFRRGMRREFAPLIAPLLDDPVLAQLGVVNARELYNAAARAERGLDEQYLPALVFTLQVEMWLRARDGAQHNVARTARSA